MRKVLRRLIAMVMAVVVALGGFSVSSPSNVEAETVEKESETVTCGNYWTTFTSGYVITEDTLTLTLTTTCVGSSYWENMLWVLYTSSSGYICTSGSSSDAAQADDYVEYTR